MKRGDLVQVRYHESIRSRQVMIVLNVEYCDPGFEHSSKQVTTLTSDAKIFWFYDWQLQFL
jgi:hypothetical protein